ncbi:MAG TPA: hypothetical protein VM694_41985 [Polyangium sp.]|nr:hypothetical protein [Polyangium sp.]
MKRRVAIVLLTLGTIGGYAAGFASLRCHSWQRRQHFENHVAKVCVDAARRGEVPAPPPPPAPPR